jgi:predicted metal-dependent peptidase
MAKAKAPISPPIGEQLKEICREAKDKITKAKAGLMFSHTFWASLVFKPEYREDFTCQTGYTNGIDVGYNPEFIKNLTLGQTKTFEAHECGGHNGFAHHVRRGSRNPRKWNRACDYVVNGLLDDCKFEPIPGWLLDHRFDGMSAEEVYEMLPDEPEDNDPNGGEDPGGCGGVRDMPGKDGKQPTPAEIQKAIADANVAIAQAAQQARAMGNLPSCIEKVVGDILEPKIGWREVLERFINCNAKNDYRMFPPNKKYIHKKIYLPSTRSDELEGVVFGFDVSGSVTSYTSAVEQFFGEVSGVLEDFQSPVDVVYFDTAVTRVDHFEREDLPIHVDIVGGGGTDFRPLFDYLDENGISPTCLIVLTDLECSRFPDEPEYPVLWAYLGTRGETPPFGEVIHIPVKDE